VTADTVNPGCFERFVGFVAGDRVAVARVVLAACSLTRVADVTVVIFTAEA
jgi:hypothetical protein